MIIIEDKNKDIISMGLYNQTNFNMKYDDLKEKYPEGLRIGIKQPYLKLSLGGNLALRNDNKENIILEYPEKQNKKELIEEKWSCLEYKKRGNWFCKQEQYQKALNSFKMGL